jgi:hypothetical protein
VITCAYKPCASSCTETPSTTDPFMFTYSLIHTFNKFPISSMLEFLLRIWDTVALTGAEALTLACIYSSLFWIVRMAHSFTWYSWLSDATLIHWSPVIMPSVILWIRIYRGSFFLPISFKVMLRKTYIREY